MHSLKAQLKKVSGIIIFSIGLFATVQVSAATTCDNASTQAALNQCTAAELATEDSKLNKSYKKLQSLLNKSDKQQLKNVQLVWIDFRDKDCKFSARNMSGGSGYPMEINSCLTSHNHQRRIQLDQEIQNMEK